MRFDMTSSDRPKQIAKRLRAALDREGTSLPLTAALTITARLYGYRDWQDLASTVGTNGQSLDDSECTLAEIQARRRYQVAVLVSAGLAAGTAERLVTDLHPTSVRAARDAHALAAILADLLERHGSNELRIIWSEGPSTDRIMSRDNQGVFSDLTVEDKALFKDLERVFGGAPARLTKVRLAAPSEELVGLRIQHWASRDKVGHEGGLLAILRMGPHR